MAHNFIDYGRLVDEAMHLIVHNVLKMVQDHGLPGSHHFFISFATKHPGVSLSKALTNKYPKEMTIVLQYQFQDLIVDSKGFGVTLSFTGVKEKIYIPFTAVTTFADPSVQFGLQFREVDYGYDGDISLDIDNEALSAELSLEDPQSPDANAKGKKSKKDKENNVVSLDKFRKK